MAALVFGQIPVPAEIGKFGDVTTGPARLIQLSIRLLVIFAGLYALFNIVFAGYAFLSAGDDPKKIAGAWGKIWQSALGLAVVAGAVVLGGIFSYLIFGNWNFILTPTIPTIP